jgi:hypothetical protein
VNDKLIRAALEREAERLGAYRFVLAYGVAYVPIARPDDVEPGERHRAFHNAHRLAVARNLRYCEGYTLPRGYDDVPNRHAWCVDAAGTVIDPSPGWADPGGALRDCYLGVAIPVAFAAPYLEGRGRGVLYELTNHIDRLATELGVPPV